jgi:hypothetical protein
MNALNGSAVLGVDEHTLSAVECDAEDGLDCLLNGLTPQRPKTQPPNLVPTPLPVASVDAEPEDEMDRASLLLPLMVDRRNDVLSWSWRESVGRAVMRDELVIDSTETIVDGVPNLDRGRSMGLPLVIAI